jgi:hypothetical protein
MDEDMKEDPLAPAPEPGTTQKLPSSRLFLVIIDEVDELRFTPMFKVASISLNSCSNSIISSTGLKFDV